MNNSHLKLIQGLNSGKILIIGDVMLDKYYYGEVQRISPEAPVPIAHIKNEENTLGGAANVAHNLALLGCQVKLLGVVGKDNYCSELKSILEEKGIEDCLLISGKRSTTTKLRIIGAHQQMMRVDFEDSMSLDPEIEAQLLEIIKDEIKNQYDCVILSDYAKGVCTESICTLVINNCKNRKIPVLVDPKGQKWDKYQNAFLITPNIKELSDIAGTAINNEDDLITTYGREILQKYGIANLIVTRSEKGLSLINSTQVNHIPTKAKEVFDVSGAGDTVVAVLAMLISNGTDLNMAAEIANFAAGIVVGKIGTYALHKDELIEAVQNEFSKSDFSRKILSWREAQTLVTKWRSKNETIVFTNGCFDILHTGHITYLEKAKKLGNRLIIGLNTDNSIQRLKGPLRPIFNETDRAKLLASLESVDMVVLFDQDTPAEILRLLRPDVLVKGSDYKVEEVIGREYAGRVELISFENGYSTSNIIREILLKYAKSTEATVVYE